MDITQLPSELLDLVFGQFANILLSDDPNLTLWKDVLPLVGVSRQWRALATRHVYKYLFIECHDEEEVVDEDEMDDTESIDQSSCLLPPLWLTNICLFQHNNINQYARNIIIYVDASISFSNFIFQTVDLLKLGTVTWSNLQYMDICVNTAIENPDNSADNNNDTMAQNLEQAASLLARHFTNIKHLRIFADKSHLSYKPTATFSNKLLNLTAKHLTSLITFLPTRLQLSTFTSQLTKLRLTFAHVDTCYIPHVFSDTLKELYINCAPRKFPWDCFTKTSGSQQITFVNLTALTIIFRPPEDTPLQELLSTT
ncbi:hypothetical protein EV180_001426 [Coemansia sp. RSA 518]|nr:hypothetical protein EV180_001426 [Coemansia sp. RSA 518]KAJ2289535.1 hypothetical protein IW141_003780 [Coemansia sp. RSA 355]